MFWPSRQRAATAAAGGRSDRRDATVPTLTTGWDDPCLLPAHRGPGWSVWKGREIDCDDADAAVRHFTGWNPTSARLVAPPGVERFVPPPRLPGHRGPDPCTIPPARPLGHRGGGRLRHRVLRDIDLPCPTAPRSHSARSLSRSRCWVSASTTDPSRLLAARRTGRAISTGCASIVGCEPASPCGSRCSRRQARHNRCSPNGWAYEASIESFGLMYGARKVGRVVAGSSQARCSMRAWPTSSTTRSRRPCSAPCYGRRPAQPPSSSSRWRVPSVPCCR